MWDLPNQPAGGLHGNILTLYEYKRKQYLGAIGRGMGNRARSRLATAFCNALATTSISKARQQALPGNISPCQIHPVYHQSILGISLESIKHPSDMFAESQHEHWPFMQVPGPLPF